MARCSSITIKAPLTTTSKTKDTTKRFRSEPLCPRALVGREGCDVDEQNARHTVAGLLYVLCADNKRDRWEEREEERECWQS
jgi:hypothetical protein